MVQFLSFSFTFVFSYAQAEECLAPPPPGWSPWWYIVSVLELESKRPWSSSTGETHFPLYYQHSLILSQQSALTSCDHQMFFSYQWHFVHPVALSWELFSLLAMVILSKLTTGASKAREMKRDNAKAATMLPRYRINWNIVLTGHCMYHPLWHKRKPAFCLHSLSVLYDSHNEQQFLWTVFTCLSLCFLWGWNLISKYYFDVLVDTVEFFLKGGRQNLLTNLHLSCLWLLLLISLEDSRQKITFSKKK